MRYSLVTSVEPAAEPLTLTEAKLHLKVDVTADDTLITALIQAAREWAENYTRRSFVQRTLELRLDCFPGVILLPRGPVISLTSLEYLDQGGTLTAVDASVYQSDLYSTPARLMPGFGQVWPTAKYGTLNSVTATYVAGYEPSSDSPTDYAANIPQAIKAAMKLMLGHWYENREAVVLANMQALEVPLAVKSVLAPFEIRDFCLE